MRMHSLTKEKSKGSIKVSGEIVHLPLTQANILPEVRIMKLVLMLA